MLVPLLDAIAHHQHCMVHILTVAIFIIVHTYETNQGWGSLWSLVSVRVYN